MRPALRVRARGQATPVDVHEPVTERAMRARGVLVVAVVGHLQHTVLAGHEPRAAVHDDAEVKRTREHTVPRRKLEHLGD